MIQEKILNDGSIYHYTSIEGLKGILEENAIWLTHYEFFNDPDELKYCNRGEKRNITNLIVEQMPVNKIPMIVSFSEEADSYSLWSNYTNHFGYNIEFDVRKLRRNFYEFKECKGSEWIDLFIEGKMIYDPDIRKKIINYVSQKNDPIFRDLVSYMLSINPELKKLSNEEKVQKMASSDKYVSMMQEHDKWDDFAGNIGYLFGRNVFFKSDLFNIENEYRYCFLINKNYLSNKMSFRLKDSFLVPYISVPLSIYNKNKNPIKSITLGPKNLNQLNEKSIEYFLKYKNLDYIKIKESKIRLQ